LVLVDPEARQGYLVIVVSLELDVEVDLVIQVIVVI
jgi:hypothetical protein